MGVDDEPMVLGDLVVECAASGIGVVGLPVDPAGALSLGSTVDSVNELAADTFATRLRRSEQVLQVASELEPGGTAVIEKVREADKLTARLGNEGMHRLGWIEEARPSCACDCWVERGSAFATVERVVAQPEWKPSRVVGFLNFADDQ